MWREQGLAPANDKAVAFLTGCLIEKSLAVDKLFVFLTIFTCFALPRQFQKRVLMSGIVGAIVLRTVMILVGAWLIAPFHWMMCLFGAFPLVTDLESKPAVPVGCRCLAHAPGWPTGCAQAMRPGGDKWARHEGDEGVFRGKTQQKRFSGPWAGITIAPAGIERETQVHAARDPGPAHQPLT